MAETLSNLPDLQPQPRRELDAVVTIRLSGADRQRLERAAAELGTSVSRLLRAITRRALAQAVSNDD